MTEPAADRSARGLWRLAAVVALAMALGVLVLLAALYAARRQIAREAVTNWLKSRTIVSESQFQELGPGHLVGRIRIGPAQSPDLVAPRAEVSYSLIGLLSGRGVEVTSIRLVDPVLQARWQGGRFSAGALDPLIDEFRKRPPRPGAPSPRVEIAHGHLRLATDYGAVNATADALIDNGKLVRLDATSAPMRLNGQGFAADLGAGRVRARAAGDRLSLQLLAPLTSLGGGPGQLRDGALSLDVRGTYPDLTRPAPATGEATAELRAASARAGGVTTGPLLITGRGSDLRWSRAGGDRLAGRLSLAGTLRSAATSDLRLASAAGDLAGTFAVGRQAMLHLAGSAEGRGAWTGLGAPAKGDSAEIVAVKRALRGFRISAQGLEVDGDGRALRSRLAGPVRLLPATGGEVRLTPRGGGYRLSSAGGGLPAVEADVRRFAVAAGGATADASIKAALSLGPLQKAVIDAAGTLRIAAGTTSFTADRCASVTAARLNLGTNSAEHVTTRICPTGGPLLRIARGGWSLAGRAENAAASIPFLQASLAEGSGQVRLADAGGKLSADLQIASGRVRDAAPAERFHPMILSGRVGLARDLWTGGLDIRLPGGAQVAHATLRHEGLSGVGGVEIATGPLSFAAGGLQPADLSPIAKPLGTGVEGAASFTGAFRWTPAGPSSGGELHVARLDFKSPMGAVTGLSGDVRFTSLSPLIAPPGQNLRVQALAAALPLTDLTASAALQEKALVVTGGSAAAGGGRLRIARLDIPFEAGQPIKGVLEAEGVQLRDLIKASPFGDRVSLAARVSGQIPFESQGGKVRITGGELHAIAPGRLSISRAALTSVSAQGSVQAPAQAGGQIASDDTFTDFAYQALENLAFDGLSARVDTRPDGRLGVLFHVVGRHDPPQHQEITLSWLDLVRRKFLGKKLPLPSGTGVDLTLDTTLNLDDLLKDYADFQQLRSSPPVQP
ncbi:MAG: hypothetical protein JWP49_883 [Phenylobacterium sp.]|nr:hypothetical protein [Phenylobacterium sp.]